MAYIYLISSFGYFYSRVEHNQLIDVQQEMKPLLKQCQHLIVQNDPLCQFERLNTNHAKNHQSEYS